MREIRSQSREELAKGLADLRKEMIKLGAERAKGAALKNPGEIARSRRAISRIMLALSEKEASAKHA
ncbi:TPA: 50S ribosomal protein L29 [Candidatus Woesearchaeota archaeon]|nr:50S ribosomal protein L29 [Candidatus Woesearchaeota archaeon]